MGKLLIILYLFCLSIKQQSKDITGKWVVEKIDVSKLTNGKLTQQQRDAITNSLVKPLSNAVFDFKADHHFSLSANLGNMPKDDSWEYNDTDETIIIREYNDARSKLMIIKVSHTNGNTFFVIQDPTVVLKMHRMLDQ